MTPSMPTIRVMAPFHSRSILPDMVTIRSSKSISASPSTSSASVPPSTWIEASPSIVRS